MDAYAEELMVMLPLQESWRSPLTKRDETNTINKTMVSCEFVQELVIDYNGSIVLLDMRKPLARTVFSLMRLE